VPDLLVPETAETPKGEQDKSMSGKGSNERSHRSFRRVNARCERRKLNCLNLSSQGVILHDDASMADASYRVDDGVRPDPSRKEVVLLDASGPADAACLSSRGLKERTRRLPTSYLQNRVNAGSPKRTVSNRSARRQSRHSSQMLEVMFETAIRRGWTNGDESVRAIGSGILTERVKGGSDHEAMRPTRWVC
jgi:hypothetical protein